jgi:hypothetical protein
MASQEMRNALSSRAGGAPKPAAQPTSGSGDAMVDVLRPIDENSLLWLSQQPVGRMPPRPVEEVRPYRQSPFQRIGNFAQDAMQGAGMDRYAARTLRGQLFGAQGDKGRGIGVADFVPGLDTSAAADDYRANPGLLTGAGVGLSMLPLVGGVLAKGIGRLGRGLLDDVPTSMFDVDPTMPAKLVNPEMRVWQGGPNLYGPDVPGTKPGLDSSKIGTGEGAQVYGQGHYLAENPDVGREYAKNLANRNPNNQSRLNAHANAQRLVRVAGDEQSVIDDILFALEQSPDNKDLLEETLSMVRSGEYKNPLANPGHLYEYDLPDETIAKMLDWDKPLSEQPESVRRALGWNPEDEAAWYAARKADTDSLLGALDGDPNTYKPANLADIQAGRPSLDATGEQIIGGDKLFADKRGSSAALREAGIPGIRYLDQGSRSGGKGTSNFVLFDDDAAKLLARDDTRFDLPTDEASRMARAREMGFDVDTPWYHGTTHDIQEFGGGAHNVEGHFGAGHYFTDSPLDASANYAGVGPDLTNRIEQRAERIAKELYDTSDKPQEVLDRFGRMQAKRELKGPNDGAVYPALLRGKTVDVSNYTRGQPTILESSPMPSAAEFYDEASKKLGSTASHEEIYDLAESLADDAFADWVPTGQLADFADGIRESAQQYGFDANEVLESIQDELIEGVASADSLDRSLRNSPLMYAEDPETGALVMNDVIRKAFNRAGFDNIVMDAKSAFPKMPNIPEGTRHIITSKPENIRSRFAQFDPAKAGSADILAGLAGLGVLGAGAAALPQDDSDMVSALRGM